MKYLVNFEDKALSDIRKITESGRKSDIKKLELILEE